MPSCGSTGTAQDTATDGIWEPVRRRVDLYAVGIVTGIKRNHLVEITDVLSL